MPIKFIGANYAEDNSAVPQVDGKVVSATTATGVVRNIFVSTSTPSGGSNGDVWIQYV